MEQQKQLSHVEYWDTRYIQWRHSGESQSHGMDARGDSDYDYEWCRTFESLQPFLNAQLPPSNSGCTILHLGCGTSTLTADLFNHGYVHQVSVDFSTVAIEEMRRKYAHLRGLVWQTADVRDMREIETGKFDIAIDKATLDAMIFGSPWDPEEESKQNVKKYVGEVARVLAEGGKWLYITYRQPHFVKPLLAREGTWNLAVHSLTGSSEFFEYFAYVMTKHPR